ncbi:exopolyphosphatase [Thorsellia anophelis]|nr:exopolyphosphatase [Thorsellia anophelis]
MNKPDNPLSATNNDISTLFIHSPLIESDSSNAQSQSENKHLELAAIDLGSNSFHMIIARIVNGSFQVLSRLKQRVQLIDGMSDSGELSEESIKRALSCLSLFAERLQGFEAERVRVVASYSLRAASNASEFLTRSAEVLPYPIEVVSGQEEARLIYMGVAHTQPEQGKKLVIDIGGGSTEMIIGEGFTPIIVESTDMGCVSFANQFFPDGMINRKAFDKAVLAGLQNLEAINWRYYRIGWDYVLGTSGTIKAVHQVLFSLGEFDGILTLDKLKELAQILLQYKHVSEIQFPDISEERQKVLIPGLAILIAVFQSLEIKSLRFADSALREGVLYEMEGLFRHEDIRVRTAESFAEHYAIDRAQVARVMETAEFLYEQWKKQTQPSNKQGFHALLRWAVILHEVGLSINQTSMHRHSAYILQHSNLPGFSQEQQLLLATLVRYQRRSIKQDEIPKFNLYKKRHYMPLLQIFRLSVLLNNQRQSTTKPDFMLVNVDGMHWQLTFPKGYLEINTLMELDLQKEQVYWEAVTGWQLDILELT